MVDGYLTTSIPSNKFLGANIFIYGTKMSPFSVGRKVSIRNLAFYYPAQQGAGSIIPYPPTLDFYFNHGSVQFVYIENNVFLNSYDAIRIDNPGGDVGHIWIQGNGIYGIHNGVRISMNAELIHLLNNNFTYGIGEGLSNIGLLAQHTRNFGTAVLYEAGDGMDIHGNLFFGYYRAIHIPGRYVDLGVGHFRGYRGVILTNITSNKFDQVAQAIVTTNQGTIAQSSIANNTFVQSSGLNINQFEYGIYLNGALGIDNGIFNQDKLVITGNYFGQSRIAHIAAEGPAYGSLVINGNTFEGIGTLQVPNSSGVTTPAVLSVNSPNLIVNFSSNHIVVSGSVYAPIIGYNLKWILANNNTFANLGTMTGMFDFDRTKNIRRSCQFNMSDTVMPPFEVGAWNRGYSDCP